MGGRNFPRGTSALRRGLALPIVVVGLLLFMIFAGTFLFSSKGEYRLLMKSVERERARYIAEAGLAKASALIYQNAFVERWYKGKRSKYGFCDSFTEQFGGGVYEVFAEDVIHPMSSTMVTDKEERIRKLRYARIDLFARGRFGRSSIILYQSIVLHPEEAVYTADIDSSDPTRTRYSKIELR